jgi:hypothetical protein
MGRTHFVCATAGYLLLAAGCSRQEDVTRYAAVKPKQAAASTAMAAMSPPTAHTAGTHMHAAIVLRGDKAWFFKATGPAEAMTERKAAFLDFTRSIRSDANGMPEWTLPLGWVQKPGNSMRFATIEMGAGAALCELSVTVLPKNDDDTAYVLANVNRWREQLALPPTSPDAVSQLPTEKLADGTDAILVELVGESAVGQSNPHSTAHDAPSAPRGHFTPASKVAVRFDSPTNWTAQALRGSRRAAFTVQHGEHSAEITVQSFPAAAPLIADPLANVNRWRGELGLEPMTQNEVDGAAKKLTISGEPAVYVEIMGPQGPGQKAIFAALFKFGEEMWFIKLIGDAALAERERDRLAGFLGSLRLAPQETPDGD